MGIPESWVRSEFDVGDPMLQLNLQLAYWVHMDEVLGRLEERSRKLQNLSNKSDEAQQYREWMEDEIIYNVWRSPFGAKLWAQFGLNVLDQTR